MLGGRGRLGGGAWGGHTGQRGRRAKEQPAWAGHGKREREHQEVEGVDLH